jgi:hypothetical protein
LGSDAAGMPELSGCACRHHTLHFWKFTLSGFVSPVVK